MSKLQLLLLGHFECLLPSGEPVTLSMRKAEVLLTFLALAPGIRHPRERLINLLWSDRGDEQARNSLRQCLSAIRKSLGGAAELALQVDRSTVSLRPDALDVDALEFERLAEDSEFDALSTAAELYRGEFLEGISIRDAACQEWLDSERARFRRQYLEILTQLGQAQLAANDFTRAIRTGELLTEHDALAETGWRLLMRACHANGNRNHALQAFKRCQQVLRNELGVEPEAKTIALRDAIASGESIGSPARPATAISSSPRTVPEETGEHSIAVLPFDNLSGDPEQEYFSDGITDSIILNLARFPGLQVKSRHSSFAFKEQIKSAGDIGEELQVDYIVEGSIRRSQERVRITVQLIDSGHGNQIWGNRYDADLSNLFELEEELSRSIAATVTGQIESDLRRIAIAKGAEGHESYDLLLAGRYHASRFNRQDNLIAIDKLNQCLQQDPDNVRAHGQLYVCHSMNYLDRWTEDYRKSFEIAELHIQKALALAPEHTQILASYAEYLVFAGHVDEAMKPIDKALQVNPHNPETLAVKAVVQIVQEDFEGALETAEYVLQLDPYHPWVEWELCGAQYWSGHYEAALQTISAMRTDPGFTYLYAAASHAKLGQEEDARKVLREFLRGCEERMLSMPHSREEWLDYCQSGYRFKDLKWHRDMVDSLIEVGLIDESRGTTVASPANSHTIAVLPFDNLSGDPAQEYFSDGISESVILHLNCFPGLEVKSRHSSFAFKQQIKSLGDISAELKVDYLVEGSLRKSDEQIRITVQLVDASSGNQVWGKRYDAPLDDLFSLEEDLSRSIAATVTGKIESDLQRIAIAKGAAQQESYDLLLAGTYHLHRFNRKDNALAIEKLNQCLAKDPDNVRAHVHLSTCHLMDYLEHWSDDLPESANLIETHIHKAMALNSELGLVLSRYAEHLFFKQEFDEADRYLEQALAINSNDPDALIIKAVTCIVRNDFETAVQISQRVCELDPYHPFAGWELTAAQYFSGFYEAALDTISRAGTSPGFESIFAIAANIKLGRTDKAKKLLQVFLRHCRDNMKSMPHTLDEWFEYTSAYYPCTDTTYNQDLVDCLVQAGLTDSDGTDSTSKSHTIAVLPFDNLSGDPEQEYFSDGISESIILHLNRFPDLTVKSRNSSFAFKQQIKSLGEISEELGVDYLVEGSLRKSAEQIRITVQLVEAASGNQIWGKRYDGGIEDLFDLEEDVSRSVAATVTGQIKSDLERIALSKGASDQQAYDLLLAGLYHLSKTKPADMPIAIDYLDRCLELDPGNARAHAALYFCHSLSWMERWTEDYKPAFERAAEHAQKALELGPELAYVQFAYAEYQIFCHNYENAIKHVDTVLAINPNDTDALTTRAMALGHRGDFEGALAVAELAYQLDPYHPWADWILAESHFFCGNYEQTLQIIADSNNAPGFIRLYNVAANIRLGRNSEARVALRVFLDECRSEMRAMPCNRDEWMAYTRDNAPFSDSDLNRQLIDCLVEAGLEEELIDASTASASDMSDATTAAHTIAVLPFDNLSGDPAQEYFSDGFTESIIMHLDRFPGLAVKSRNSSFAFKQQIKSLGEISQELAVAYLVEGSVRKSAEQIRVTVQLIEAASGVQVWGKRYDAPLDDLFNLEEELSRSIAATVTGQIESDLQRIALTKGASDQQAYDLLLAGIYHNQRYTREDTAVAIEKLGQCLQKDPGNAMAHAWLYVSHLMNYLDRWTPDHKASFELGAQHIHKARSLLPNDTKVQMFYAQYLMFCGEFTEPTKILNKLLQNNPNHPDILTTMALNLELQAEFTTALEYAERACQLDPFHPWAEWELAGGQYYSGYYEKVLETIAGMRTTPGFIQIYAIAANIKLGRKDAANLLLQEFLEECKETMQTVPVTLEDWMTYARENYPFSDAQYNREIVDCLLQAGLEDELIATSEPGNQPSILVLPFSNLSGDPDQDYFSDGITDSIIASLGAFSGPGVKSRHTSFAFKDSDRSVEEIAAELEVNYIVEGSIRKSANQVRINVQLIESASGNQLWSKRFDADFNDLFTLEEDLTRTIAATISGRVGKELKSQSLHKPTQNLQSYDYFMRGLYHIEKFSRSDNQIARAQFEKSIEHDPHNCEAHALLAETWVMELYENWTADRDEARRMSRLYTEKAVELEPDNALAQAFLSEQLLINREFERSFTHAQRAINLNPTLPDGYSMKCGVLGCTRRYEEGLKNADISMQIDPYHPYTGWNAGEIYRSTGQYERAIEAFRSVPYISPSLHAQTAAALSGLGKLDEARVEMQHYLELAREQMPRLPASRDEWRELWSETVPYEFEADTEALFDLLLHAGLCDATDDTPDDIPSLLVLPFSNLSGDPEQAYFSDGISESIIMSLGLFKELNVKSRHASFALRDSSKSMDEIADELGVQFIVEGSIRKQRERLRITVQLAETGSGNQLWGKRYDTPLEDLFELEEELVQTIAATVSARIDRRIKQVSVQKPAQSLKSYDYLMRGWYHAEHFDPDNISIAIECMRKCLEIEPDNASAHSKLAATLIVLVIENWAADRETVRAEAEQHHRRALELDSTDALAQAFMAEHQILLRNFDKALFHANTAIALNPSLPDGYNQKALILGAQGKHSEALKLAELSIDSDPHHFYMAWNAAIVYRDAGEYRKAIDAFRLLPYPPPSVRAELASALVGAGELDLARQEMAQYLQLARVHMAHYPNSTEAWRTYWYDISSYAFDEDFDAFFDLLLLAGLCDDEVVPGDGLPSIAVLPFVNLSDDVEQEYFSDGITSSLILSLGMFQGLNVKSRGSSFAFKQSDKPSSEIARQLAADFLIEGSIRKAGKRIRLAVQLVEAESDTQIWGKQYDAELVYILDLEQELSATIAATISGRIGHRIQQSAVRKPASSLKSYDYLLRGLYHMGKFTAPDMKIAQQQIEKCLALEPDNAEAHMQLGMIHFLYHYENWTTDREATMQTAEHHLTRALELAPDNAQVQAYYSELKFGLRDFERAEFHANKAIELNPTASDGYTAKADVLAATRRYDEALELADLISRLDPHAVGTGWIAGEVYRITGHYDKAIKSLRSISHPPTTIHALIAACYAGLGQIDQAYAEMDVFHKRVREEMPESPGSRAAWRDYWKGVTSYQHEPDFEDLMSQLLQAGLCEADKAADNDMPSIAVLPFDNMSGEPEQEHFADGITSDIIATLSKFKHLRTVSRYSTLLYKDEKASISEVATQQDVRYILEGSVRKSGSRIRVGAELIDASTEQVCWSERYDRNLDDLFAVQDEITREITLAMKVHLDDGDMARHRSDGTDSLKAWELTLTASDLSDTYIRQNIIEGRKLAKQALELDPDYGFALVILAWTYWQEVYAGWSEDIEYSLEMSEKFSASALQLNPDHADALAQAGIGSIMRHDTQKSLEYCRRAIELEPGNAENQALMGFSCVFSGDYETARVHDRLTRELCPILPNWYYLVLGQVEMLDGDLAKSIAILEEAIMVEPESPLCRFYLINALMKTGNDDAARFCADEIKALDPGINGRGLVRAFSIDEAIRDEFQQNLAQFKLA